MPIPYVEQAGIMRDTGFRARVEAGVMVVALAVDTLPPITGTALAQRKTFANQVIATSRVAVETVGVDQFCWTIVGKPQVDDVGQLDDSQINTVIKQNWDRIAQAMVPAGGP